MKRERGVGASEEEREREEKVGQGRSCGPIGQELETKRSPGLETGEREVKLSAAPLEPPAQPGLQWFRTVGGVRNAGRSYRY